MAYPDNINFAALERATRSHSSAPRRAPSPAEVELRARVSAVLAAVEALRSAYCPLPDDGDGEDARQSLLIDVPEYCGRMIACIDAQPEEEARAEEERQMEDWI